MNLQFLKSLAFCNILAVTTWLLLMLLSTLFYHKDSRFIKKPGMLLLMLLYFASIISITLVPLPFSTNRRPSHRDLNFVPILNSVKIFLYPFQHNRMALLPDILGNIFGNILLFVPLGFLLPLCHKKFWSAFRTTGFAILFSVGIEAMQWIWRHFGNYRHVDVDDVILNTLGAMIGFLLFRMIRRLLWLQQIWRARIVRVR